MKRIGTLAALVACVFLASCKGTKIRTDDSGTTVEVAPPAPAPDAAGAGGAEDRHWIRADEVFLVMYDGQTNLECFEVTPARVVEGATEATKGQAKLFELRGAKERWSADFWKSRPAERGDIKLGTKVIFFKGPMKEGSRAHHAPASKADARPGGDAWFCSTVNDDSNLFQDEAKVAGYDYAIKVEALRVVQQ